MRRTFLFLVLMMAGLANAQTIQQNGVAYRYNGKQKRTPLGNVTILYDGNKRTVISGSENGTFNLVLEGKKMGDRIGLVTVKKREMMVFNQHAVDEWNVRKEPLTLILCNADEFERQKENLIAIGRSQAKKKYERQKAELEKKLQEGEIKMAEKEAALDKAYEELERLQKNIGEYADLFARIDESEIDTLAQQAVELFYKGEIEAAIRLFEEGHYMEKLEKAIRISKQARDAKAKIEITEELAARDSIRALLSLKAQIEAYKMNNEWAKAGKLLKEIADKIDTYELCNEYAYFCHGQHYFEDSEIYFKRGLSKLEDLLTGSDSLNYEVLNQYASTLNGLGYLYNDFEEYTKAKEILEKAVKIHRSLADLDFQLYGESLVIALTNLGNSDQWGNNTENIYLEALKICQRLSSLSHDNVSIMKCMALLQSNLGMYYNYIANLSNYIANLSLKNQSILYDKSEDMLNKALEIRRELAKRGDDDSYKDLAWTLDGLGQLQMGKECYGQSIKYLEEAYELRRMLVQKNSDAYEPELVMTLSHLSDAYFYGDMQEQAEWAIKESIALYRRLREKYPRLYWFNLDVQISHLSNIYENTQRTEEIEKLYIEEMSIWESLKEKNIENDSYFMDSQKRLADFYKENKRYDEAEYLYLSVNEIYERLASIDFKSYGSGLSMTQENLATIYCEKQMVMKADSILTLALDNRRKLVDSIPELRIVYYPDLANTLQTLGLLKLNQEFLLEALSLLNEAVGIYKEYKDTLPALEEKYLDSMYMLCLLNIQVKNYDQTYNIGIELLPQLRNCYLSDKDSYMDSFSTLLGYLSFVTIFSEKYIESEQFASEGLTIDSTKHWIATNLAAALLFQGKYTEAKRVYLQYKVELKDSFLNDFKQFAEAGVIPEERKEYVEIIKQILNDP